MLVPFVLAASMAFGAGPDPRADVALALEVGGGPARATTVRGKCFHYADREHYGKRAEVWSVTVNDPKSGAGVADLSLNVTRVKGADGYELILNGQAARKFVKVNTGPGAAAGAGTVSVAPAGAGFAVTLDVRADVLGGGEPVAIRGTVTCAGAAQR